MRALANGGEGESYFGKKTCDIVALAIVWEEMNFEHDALLKALTEWRDWFKRSWDQT